MADSFNVILDEAARAAGSLDGAREALQNHRSDLELVVADTTAHRAPPAAVAERGRVALATTDAPPGPHRVHVRAGGRARGEAGVVGVLRCVGFRVEPGPGRAWL